MRTTVVVCAIALALAGCRGSDSHLTVKSDGASDVPASSTVSSRPATITTGPPQRTVTTTAIAPPGVTAGRWKVVDSGPLATRGEPKAVRTGHEVIVVGGLIIDQYQALVGDAPPRPPDPIANAYAYNPVTDTWRPVPLPPSTTAPHAVVWTGTRLLVWQPGEPSPGALYDPAANRWTAILANTVPGAVSAGAAVWTGDALAVEGSVTPDHGGPVEQRLFLFDPAKLTWRVSSRPPTELGTWPFLFGGAASGQVVIVGPSAGNPSAGNPPGGGTTLVYDPAADRWRSFPAPFSNAATAGEALDGGVLAFGTGPLHLLGVDAGVWSDSGSPPGPPVGDGVLVSTGSQAFVFGITSNGGSVEARQPNAAYTWAP